MDSRDMDTTSALHGAAARGRGIIPQRQPGLYSLRLRVPLGLLTSAQLSELAGIAERHGEGRVHVTTRQGIEIPGVPEESVSCALRELAEAGISPGSCGPRVRNVLCCPGLDGCSHALVNSRELAAALDRAFLDVALPVKMKVAVAACPNACTTPQINDIGFVGAVHPELDPEACVGCGLCEAACREGAIRMVDDNPALDAQRCLACAECIAACPTGGWTAGARGFVAYVGGKGGRHPRFGVPLPSLFDVDGALELVRAALDLLCEHGRPKERLASVLDRVGIDALAEGATSGVSGL